MINMWKRVEPIRDRAKIEEIKTLLKEEGNIRDLLFFVAGINFALRAGDLLELKVRDLFFDGKIREYFDIVDGKTKKKNRIFITEGVEKVLKEYIIKYPYVAINPDNYLFFTKNWKWKFTVKWAGLIIKRLAARVWIIDEISSHSLRKTWAYHARKNDTSLSIIQKKLNHSNPQTTERYLWITTEEVWKVCLDLNL